MGTFAPPARADWRGFVLLGLIFGAPIVALLFVIEAVLRIIL